MVRTLKAITTAFFNHITRVGMERVRRDLLARSDDFLADAGFSRELLRQGVSAWPWRETGVNTEENRVVSSDRDFQKAVAELSDYNDTELADLGLSRAGIKHAVRYGRPGLDDNDGQHAA